MRDRLLSWALPAVAFGAAFLPATRPYFGFATGPVAGLVAALLAALAARMVPERYWPLFAVAAVDAVVRSPGVLLAVASFVAGTAYRRPIVYAVVASLVAVLPRPGVDLVSSLGGAPLFVWFPLIVGQWITSLREAQAARAEQARAEERTRIARDMHDVVAHRVSLMVLRAGALEINARDEKTAAEAELIRITGREALSQLRAVLGVLEEGEQRTLADVDWLIEQSRSVGVTVDRRDEGTVRELPALVDQTGYRIVQEALTNVHKHARSAATHVVLRYLPAKFEVTVKNTAPSDSSPAMPGGGRGLIGLKERVEKQGGRFTAGPEPDGGFLVSAEFPG